MLELTITATAVGTATIQDLFPAEGQFCITVEPAHSKTVDFTYAQYNHLKEKLDAMVEAGMITYSVVDTEEARSDELLELKERTAKVATLAVTGGTVPNLVTLGIRKGDVFNKYVALTGVTTAYTVDEVNSATCFTSLTTVVAFDILAAGDKIYFSRDGTLITSTDRTVAGAITHLIATVSQSAYQRSGFGRFYVKASDSKPYFMMDTGMELSLGMTGGDPLVFKGSIAVATDFPLLAAVQTGWFYRVTADVTDNAGVLYTNTLQSFLAGSEIAWNGTDWTDLGTSSTVQEVHVAGAFVLPAGSSTTFVDTTVAGAATSCTLPAASATKLGEVIAVGDYTAGATAFNITITPAGADTIDGVAAALVLNRNNVFVSLECVSATGWKTVNRDAPVSSAAVPQAIGVAAAGTALAYSPDDHVHDLLAGANAGRVARTGAGTYVVRQDNLAAAVDPVVGDDTAAGYGVDSIWINTTAAPRRIFKCLNPAAGAAVWRQLNAQNNLAAAVAPTIAADTALGYDVNSVWLDTTANVAYICLNPAAGAAVWRVCGARFQTDSRQLAAATETLRVFRALAPGRIVACAAETGTVAAAGESMTFDVQIAGATALAGLITVDNTIAIDTPVAGVLGAGALVEFAAGELVSVVRVYVPGGGATPMRDTVVDIEVQYDL